MASSAPESIKNLVEKFKNNKEYYTSSKFDEENTKIEFINPFFEALGWDIHNKHEFAPQFKEVVFEDTVKIGGKAKAPDYSFRLGGQKIFFVEAKKPSVKIETEKSPAFQVRRYGWSAKLPLCVLTDFEELAIYETKSRPNENQNASIGRVKYYKYTEYEEKWDEIYHIISKEAVLKGWFDAFVSGQKGTKKGTSEVDSEFLKEIDEWRLILARNIALRNKDISIEELNWAVQLLIDRIIFLRMAEDRGIEKYGQLQKLLDLAVHEKDKYPIYEGFIKLCKKADLKYNSGLFHFTEEEDISLDTDNLTPRLAIDDRVFKQIFKNLYYPNSPYEFSMISPEILGNVYEQFLGKVIRLTDGHQAKVEEKPEVKKVGGVFYTPQYIVDYIVENTIGELLKGKTPNQVSKLKFVDPACGSGSFLLGAYHYLINWHIDYYSNLEKPPKNVIYTAKDGIPRLTINEKKRIVLNNIYGVDIDSQAVETTKLSLLLKVLEDQNKDVVEAQQKLFQERSLPYLGDNIRCGNSLIGTDILEQEDLTMEETININPFDWEEEFPKVFENGGFDAVIGNPPYVRQERIKEIKPYLKKHYETYTGVADLYVYFFEKALNILKNNSKFSYICSNKFIKTKYGEELRKILLKNQIMIFNDFTDDDIFSEATVDACVILVKKNYIKNNQIYVNDEFYMKQKDLNYKGFTFEKPEILHLLNKIKHQGHLIKDLDINIYRGIVTGLNKAFIINEEVKDKLLSKDINNKKIIKPLLRGRDIRKWKINHQNLYLIHSRNGLNLKDEYPSLYDYFLTYKKELMKRGDKGEYYYNLRACAYDDAFDKEKIVYSTISTEPCFVYDKDKYYLNNSAYMLLSDSINLKYLNCLLTSNLLFWFFQYLGTDYGGKAHPYRKIYIEQIPVIVSTDYELKLTELADKMLTLNKELTETKTPKEKKLVEKQIQITDKKINQLVYELYDLTEEEITIVEENIK